MWQLLKFIYTIFVLLMALYAFHFIIIFSYNHSQEINIHYSIFLIASTLFLGLIILTFFGRENKYPEYGDYFIYFLILIGLLYITLDKSLLDNEYYVSLLIAGMIYLVMCHSSEM